MLIPIDVLIAVFSYHQIGMTPREKAIAASKLLPSRLKTVRKSLGLTQEELADKAGCSVIALSKYETGVNRPTFEILVALAIALNVSVDYFIQQTEDGETMSKRKVEALTKLELVARELSVDWIESITEIAEKVK